MFIYTPLSGEDLEIFASLKYIQIPEDYIHQPVNPSELNGFYKKTHTEYSKYLMSLFRTGTTHSKETKLKMSKTRKGVPKPEGFNHNFIGGEIQQKRLNDGSHNFIQEHICPHCGKSGKSASMFRWHFDNCRLI